MRRSRRRPWAKAVALALVYTLVLGPALYAVDPPEPPAGMGIDGDVVAGAEPPGLDASEWYAAMVGSSTAGTPRGAVEALLDNPFTNLVYFYKNLNGSLAADEDDAYHVFARRCAVRTTLTENCASADIVFDHLVFTRTATSDGFYAYDIVSLTAEKPVGTVVATPPVNPFGSPNGPGTVTVPDTSDPRRDASALNSFTSETAAASQSVTESTPATENGVVRHFLPVERVTYPYPYERLAAELDDSDSADIIVDPTPSGDEGNVRGGHGALDVTQSRATLLVSGRGARRTALDPNVERAMAIKHVDIAPTVAKVLGVPVNVVAQYLNNGTAAENPSAAPALLRRQDGKPIDGLLDPKVNTFVVVIDGMLPENVTASQTPNICNLIGCPGATAPDASARATVYQQARAVMVSQTNANHTAMVTGAYGDVNGVVANTFYNRCTNPPACTTAASQALEFPPLIRVDTLFDVLRREAPQLRTAAVLGKEKLRILYDCTDDGAGNCIANSTANPEGVPVTHVRPDFLRGAKTTPPFGTDDCPAETASGSGVAEDVCIMDAVIRLSATEDPDFTFVNLGTVDGLQHVDGPNSPAGVTAVTSADQQIGRLVSYLKESGKWQDTVLIVTADHSFSWTGPDSTHRVNLQSLFAADPTILGTGENFVVVSSGGAAQVSLTSIGVGTTTLTTSQQTALKRMREIALAQTGVSEAWYRLDNALDPGQTLAANRPAWGLNDQRAGDLVVTALASGPTAGPNNPTGTGGNPFEVASGPGYILASPASGQGVLQGDHGHPGARHVPFIIVGGGDHVVDQTIAASGAVNEGDDTAANPEQAETVDIAPTVAWIYSLDPVSVLPNAAGRILSEAFTGRPVDVIPPHANRAIIFIFDADNSVRVHDLIADCLRQPDNTFACGNPNNKPVPALRSLLFRDGDGRLDLPEGTLTHFGSIATFPSVTFPNHNVVGSGVYPGHHGIVGNRYYERDVEIERDPIDPTDPRNPVFFFSSALLRLDFETLHEAVHRAFGNWAPDPEDPLCDPNTQPCNGPSGAFTASVDEPSARGADFASLETTANEDFPALFPVLVANSQEFAQDTNTTCANEDQQGYGLESILDHLGQAQARSLYSQSSTSGTPTIPGVEVSIADTTGGAAHPDPKYMIENFTLTDGAGHTFGPHGNCTRESYRDTSSRLGRVLGELANHQRFATEGEPARLGETFIVLTGDHGMENQNTAGKDFANGVFFSELRNSDIEFIWTDRAIYLPTMHADLVGPYSPGQQTATFRISDDDVNQGGGRRPIAGATVEAQNGSETQTGTTDANGFVTFTFVQPVGSDVTLHVDKDASPTVGQRATGSTSPDPTQHGKVVKTDFNELLAVVPLVQTPATTPTPTPTAPTPTPTAVCGATVLCGSAPLAGCRTPVVSQKSVLIMKDRAQDQADRVLWKWIKGAATAKADFGSPLTTTDYALCVYDGSPALVTHACAPADGMCAGRPCWKETRRGYKFRQRDVSGAGLKNSLQIVLNEGAAGSAKILVKGNGGTPPIPALPIAQPVRVQLVNGAGTCWEATYSAPAVQNEADRFKDKAD